MCRYKIYMLGLVIAIATAAQPPSFGAAKIGLTIAQLVLLPAATLGDSVSVNSDGSTSTVIGSGSVKIRKTKKKKKSAVSASKESKPATRLHILADALGDPIKPLEKPGDYPMADGATSCAASTTEPTLIAPGAPEGTCTLRAALETGNGLSGGEMRAVVIMRPGRFRLSGRLPDLTGNIELRGADLAQLPKPIKRSKKDKSGGGGGGGGATGASAKQTKEELALQKDADDYKDRDFRPGHHQLAPVASTVDGGGRHQILRTGYGSSLIVQSVRFEHGVATDEGSDDPRASIGGALCVSGTLALNNSIIRGCRAINGGGLYTEQKASLTHSILTDNAADRCGGLIYTAGDRHADAQPHPAWLSAPCSSSLRCSAGCVRPCALLSHCQPTAHSLHAPYCQSTARALSRADRPRARLWL